jgi:two-component system cell cycle response regulator
MLSQCTEPRFEITLAAALSPALPIEQRQACDAILLNLSVLDSAGLAGVRDLAAALPHTPIVILTGLDGQFLAVQAIRHGAQDYLLKSSSDTGALARSIQMAIERKSVEAQLARRANFDQLTGLVNRALFRDRLMHALALARRRGERAALLYIDLDGFKAINDTLGHAAGDEVLRLAAERFGGAVRESETIARLGGDEFTILIESLHDAAAAGKAAERILGALRAPLAVGDTEVSITASIGVAIFPDHADDGDALLHTADAAMFQAKKTGRDKVQFFRSAQT